MSTKNETMKSLFTQAYDVDIPAQPIWSPSKDGEALIVTIVDSRNVETQFGTSVQWTCKVHAAQDTDPGGEVVRFYPNAVAIEQAMAIGTKPGTGLVIAYKGKRGRMNLYGVVHAPDYDDPNVKVPF